MKTCIKCGVEKNFDHFNKRKDSEDGYRNTCKECKKKYVDENKELIDLTRKKYREDNKEILKEKKKIYDLANKDKRKKWLEDNKDKIKIQHRENYFKNKEKVNKRGKKYREDNKERLLLYYEKNKDRKKMTNKEYNIRNNKKISDQKKIYTKENKERIKEYRNINREKYNESQKRRKDENPLIKLSSNIRSSVIHAIKRSGFSKKSHTQEIVGLSFMELMIYLESKFETWMSWENYGKYNGELNFGWDIDHIIPISSAKTEDEVLKLNHHTNLQPLCSKINRDIKKDKLS